MNEIIEMTKKEYPEIDNYLLWICAVDYVMEEMGIKKDSVKGKELYDLYLKERKTFIYNTVKIEEGKKLKSEYNVSQQVDGPSEDE